jgi:hypothetical protein
MTTTEQSGIGRTMVTINILPDDILLEIFTLCVGRLFGNILDVHGNEGIWHKLVHVCRRWRCIVFASPHHLDLQILCTGKTRVKEMLDVWLTLPIAIQTSGRECHEPWQKQLEEVNNIITALKHCKASACCGLGNDHCTTRYNAREPHLRL